MPAWLTDPMTIVVVAFVTLVALGFGLARREPLFAIAASMVGIATFLLAVRWGGTIGDGADVAVYAGAIGASLWTLSVERVRARVRRSA